MRPLLRLVHASLTKHSGWALTSFAPWKSVIQYPSVVDLPAFVAWLWDSAVLRDIPSLYVTMVAAWHTLAPEQAWGASRAAQLVHHLSFFTPTLHLQLLVFLQPTLWQNRRGGSNMHGERSQNYIDKVCRPIHFPGSKVFFPMLVGMLVALAHRVFTCSLAILGHILGKQMSGGNILQAPARAYQNAWWNTCRLYSFLVLVMVLWRGTRC